MGVPCVGPLFDIVGLSNRFVYIVYIENSKRLSFDIKFSRQGFENAC